jgi:hypothetical protein
MKKIILMTVGLSVVLGFVLGNAYGQPTSTCAEWAQDTGCPECTCEPVALEHMGSFSGSDGGWVYNETYLRQMSQWGT